MWHLFWLIPVLLCVGGAGSHAQGSGNTWPATSAKADRTVAAADAKTGKRVDILVRKLMKALQIPGVSLAVVRDGKIIKESAYGLSVVEHAVSVKPETVFLLASITKSFTATAIMMLVEEGKIELDAPISRYLDGAPEAWKAITVRHLLTHTAGLKDRFEGLPAADWLLTFTKQRLYEASVKQPLDAQPGEKWQYSDQGYFLLGMILEKVSGESYRQFLTRRIFQPLGMTATTTISQDEIIPNLANGYTLVLGKLRHNRRTTEYGMVSHFGIVSSTQDMVKFDAALSTEKLLKRWTLQQMWTAAQINGAPVSSPLGSYGFGWFLSEFFGHHIVQHGGSTGTALWRLPDDHLTVIVLTNLEQLAGGDAIGIAKSIARMYVPAFVWSTHNPVPDPDAGFTAKLKAELERMAAGDPDVSLYTPAFRASVRLAAQRSSGFYKEIGPLKALHYLGASASGTSRTLYYRADYPQLPLFYTLTLDPTGKIAFLVGEAEELP